MLTMSKTSIRKRQKVNKSYIWMFFMGVIGFILIYTNLFSLPGLIAFAGHANTSSADLSCLPAGSDAQVSGWLRGNDKNLPYMLMWSQSAPPGFEELVLYVQYGHDPSRRWRFSGGSSFKSVNSRTLDNQIFELVPALNITLIDGTIRTASADGISLEGQVIELEEAVSGLTDGARVTVVGKINQNNQLEPKFIYAGDRDQAISGYIGKTLLFLAGVLCFLAILLIFLVTNRLIRMPIFKAKSVHPAVHLV
jgi:hypothetical protein